MDKKEGGGGKDLDHPELLKVSERKKGSAIEKEGG